MKIINVLMEKKIENEEILNKILRRQFAYEEHISVYMMALIYLGVDDPLIKKKKMLWGRFLSSIIKNEKDIESQLRYYKRLLKYKLKEDEIIIKAFEKIREDKDANLTIFGSLYKPFTWGVLSYDYNAE